MNKVDKKNKEKLKKYLEKETNLSVYIKQHSTVSKGLCDKPQTDK